MLGVIERVVIISIIILKFVTELKSTKPENLEYSKRSSINRVKKAGKLFFLVVYLQAMWKDNEMPRWRAI